MPPAASFVVTFDESIGGHAFGCHDSATISLENRLPGSEWLPDGSPSLVSIDATWRGGGNVSYESQVFEGAALELEGSEPATLAEAGVRQDLSRLGAGLALSAVFGLALGARGGGLDLVRHACGAPLGLLVVSGVVAPSLFVRLSLLDAPLRATQMLSTVARATYGAGLVMAGLAPAMAMLVVSIESPAAAAAMSGLGLALAGGIGMWTLLSDLQQLVAGAPLLLRSRIFCSVAVFAVLACALSARAWYAWLPLLGGGQ